MQDLAQTSIAFLGGGNMARALIGGLLKRGLAPGQLHVGEPDAPARAALERDFSVRSTADNALAIVDAQVVVLAVKPQEAATVLRSLALSPQTLLLSVAAGLRATDLSRWCAGKAAVVRAMPNRPALVGAGATGLYAGPEVATAQRAHAQQLMNATGMTVWVESEAQLDAVTALSGSGPAYFFLLAELMAQAAVREGLAPAAAHSLAAQTLYGAGLLAGAVDVDLVRLRDEVTSKGGTTAAALDVFGRGNFDQLVAQAIAAAAARSRELARQLGSD